ncbi:MAG: M3 family oligoendopeptidase [Verrucomicrobiales bacterium]|nr:M3 family oligoendopeptidase [Verrucomicrobiales bacterium]
MSLLPFGALPPYRPRRFLPAVVAWDDWSAITPLLDRLERELGAVTGARELESWLLDWGELTAGINEESARRYIAMTCRTDDAEAEKAYLRFVEEIEPRLKPRQFALEKQYLAHPARSGLSVDRYGVFDRMTEVHVALYRDENVPLETEEARIGQQYQKLSGSLTVEFRGEERTLVQMGRYLEEPDRSLRREAWERVARRRLAEKDAFDEQFDALLSLRHRIARNAGFDNYRDYAFRARGRFDYGPADCEAFHDAIATEMVPVLRELQSERRELLGLETLRPWDLAVDPHNRPPLRPFDSVERLLDGSQRVFERVDAELAAQFRRMRELRLLDLENRKGKAPGGYQSSLPEARQPFIFMNAVGQQRDVETLLHEAGHAFHTVATQGEDLYAYREAPIEFCEVASMSMELLGGEHLDAFYRPEECRRARRDHLEGIVETFPWIATVDAFQHWIYTHPEHTREERRQAWDRLVDRFGGDVDWSGWEDARSHSWHRQLHVFLYPFYYVEYGIAQIGALQVWMNSKRDRAGALAAYRRGLGLGGARRLPELFEAAGCRFAFDRETLQPLAELLRREMAAVGGD